MNKKHITHGKLKVFMILFLAVILIVLVVVCAKKIKATPHKLQSFRFAEVYQHILWITSAVLPAKAH